MDSTSRLWKVQESRLKTYCTRKTSFDNKNVEEMIVLYADQMVKGKNYATNRTFNTRFHALETVRRKISTTTGHRTVRSKEAKNT